MASERAISSSERCVKRELFSVCLILLAVFIGGVLAGLVSVGSVSGQGVTGSFDLVSSNVGPLGVWSDGETIWVIDEDERSYAYETGGGSFVRNSSKEFTGPNSVEGAGVDAANEIVYLIDTHNTSNTYARAYSISTRNRIPGEDISFTHSQHTSSSGLWFDGTTLLISKYSDREIFVYSNGVRDPSKDFNITGCSTGRGVWSDGETLWALATHCGSSNDPELQAYKLSDGSRDSVRDIPLADRNGRPRGLWSDGETMWVANDYNSNDPNRKMFYYKYRNNAHGLKVVDQSYVGRSLFAPYVGQTLFAKTSDIVDLNGVPDNPSFSYQWQRLDDVNDVWVNVSGATGEFYEVTSVDKGKKIRVRVNFTDAARYEEVLFSKSTAIVGFVSGQGVTGSFDLVSSNVGPLGVWSDGETIWVIDEDERSYAYETGGGSFVRNSSKEFTGPNSVEGAGVDAANEIVYLIDTHNTSNTYARAYSISTRNRIPGEDISFTHSQHTSSSGLWFDGTTLLISKYSDREIFVYSNGVRDPSKDFNITGCSTGRGVWSDGETLWALATHCGSSNDPELQAYKLSDGSRDSARDIPLADRNGRPRGLWSDGETMWVANDYNSNDPNRKMFYYKYRNNAHGLELTGLPFVGGRLFAVTSGIEDLNGLPDSPVFGYQWQWFDNVSGLWVNVSGGGTGEFYEVTSVDKGKKIRVRVSFTDKARYEEVLFSIPLPVLEGGLPESIVWSGLLTVGENSSVSYLGYSVWNHGVIEGDGLSDDVFSLGGVDYTIPALFVHYGDTLRIETLPSMDERGLVGLKLVARSDDGLDLLEFDFLDAFPKPYVLANGTIVRAFEWNGSSVGELGWELGDQVFMVLKREPVVLVGNVDEGVSSVGESVGGSDFVAHAQGFSTGSFGRGYRVDVVELSLRVGSSTLRPVVGIYSDSDGLPGVLLGEFRIEGDNGFAGASGVHIFKASGHGGVVLGPGEDFFVRVSGEGSGLVDLSLGGRNDWGFGGVPGWSINNSRFDSNDGGLNWTMVNSRHSLRFNLVGGVNSGGFVKGVNVNELSSSRVVVNVSVGNFDEVDGVYLRYRKSGRLSWSSTILGVVSSENVQFNLTGLESNVSYEVEASLNEGFRGVVRAGFKTLEESPPVFTSGEVFWVNESAVTSLSHVGRVVAYDPDGEDLVDGYTIVGGADQSLFTLTSSNGFGSLSFVSGRDFERPTDADGNNEYVLEVEAVSGAGGRERSARQTIKVVVLDRNEPPGVPESLVLAGSDPTSLSVSWSAPVNNGPPVNDYDVRYRRMGGGGWRFWPHSGVSTNAVITGLSPNVSYQVSVRARNAEGGGSWSSVLGGLGVFSTGELPVGVVHLVSPVNGSSVSGSVLFNASYLSGQGHDVSSLWLGYVRSGSGEDVSWLAGVNASGYWSAMFDTVGLVDGWYDLSVRINDSSGNNESVSVGRVLVDNSAPSFTLHSPRGGVTGEDVLLFNASASDSGSGVGSVWFGYVNDSLQEGPVWVDGYLGSGGFWLFELPVVEGVYVLSVRVVDGAGVEVVGESVRKVVVNRSVVVVVPDSGSSDGGGSRSSGSGSGSGSRGRGGGSRSSGGSVGGGCLAGLSGGVVSEYGSWGFVESGVVGRFKLSNVEIPVGWVEFGVSERVDDVVLLVSTHDVGGGGLEGVFYKGFELKGCNLEGVVSWLSFSFSVDESFVSGNGFGSGDVVLLRRVGGGWVEVSSSFKGLVGGSYVYEVDSGNFSSYVVLLRGSSSSNDSVSVEGSGDSVSVDDFNVSVGNVGLELPGDGLGVSEVFLGSGVVGGGRGVGVGVVVVRVLVFLFSCFLVGFGVGFFVLRYRNKYYF